MISKETIDRAILEHEEKDTTYANCERLAWLYIVRDHISTPEAYSPRTFNTSGDSEFLRAVRGADADRMLSVMDELMAAIQVLHPRMYESAIRKLTE